MGADEWAKLWSSITWGSVPDWIAAIGTVAAFVVAAVAYLWNVAISRTLQARRVSTGDLLVRQMEAGSRLGDEDGILVVSPASVFQSPSNPIGTAVKYAAIKVAVSVRNDSDEVMGPIEVALIEDGADAFIERAVLTISRVPAHDETQRFFVLNDTWSPDYHPSLRCRIVYRDAAGRWWQRFENESVRKAPRRIRPDAQQRMQAARLSRTPAGARTKAKPGTLRWKKIGEDLYIAVPNEDARR